MQTRLSQIIEGMKSSNNNSVNKARFFAVVDFIRYASKDTRDRE